MRRLALASSTSSRRASDIFNRVAMLRTRRWRRTVYRLTTEEHWYTSFPIVHPLTGAVVLVLQPQLVFRSDCLASQTSPVFADGNASPSPDVAASSWTTATPPDVVSSASTLGPTNDELQAPSAESALRLTTAPLFLLGCHDNQKCMCQHRQRRMPIPPHPRANLVLVQTDFAFGALKGHFNRPA